MRSQKGVTLTSLAIYIMILLIALGILATVTANFQSNIRNINQQGVNNAEIDKFNTYFLKEVKKQGNSIRSITNSEIVFTANNKYTFNSEDECIYLNDSIKIAENIENCGFANNLVDGKKIITVTIKAKNAEEKTIEYVLSNQDISSSYEDENDYVHSDSILPDGYIQVEYIESTGTQYIDTRYVAKSNSKFITTASFNVVENYNFENGSYDGNRLEFCAIYSGKWLFGLGSKYISVGKADTEKHVFYMDMEGLCKVDSDEYRISDSNLPCTKSNYLFAANFNDVTSVFCRIKIYSCEIYEGETCVRNFIPCYSKSDNEIGMYDIVSNVFYTNQGTGTFIAGPNI